jgi:hypothetical protein
MAVDDTTPQFGEPSVTGYKASEEEGVRKALDMNVLRVLSTTIGDLQPSKEEFYQSFVLGFVKGNPDFVLVAGGNLLLPVEVKATRNLDAPTT